MKLKILFIISLLISIYLTYFGLTHNSKNINDSFINEDQYIILISFNYVTTTMLFFKIKKLL